MNSRPRAVSDQVSTCWRPRPRTISSPARICQKTSCSNTSNALSAASAAIRTAAGTHATACFQRVLTEARYTVVAALAITLPVITKSTLRLYEAERDRDAVRADLGVHARVVVPALEADHAPFLGRELPRDRELALARVFDRPLQRHLVVRL